MKFGWKITGIIGGIFAKFYSWTIHFIIIRTKITVDDLFFYGILKGLLMAIMEGIILAYVFTKVHNKIPIENIMVKSIVYSLIWAVPVIPLNIFYYSFDLSYSIVIPVGHALVYGVLLGKFIKI